MNIPMTAVCALTNVERLAYPQSCRRAEADDLKLAGIFMDGTTDRPDQHCQQHFQYFRADAKATAVINSESPVGGDRRAVRPEKERSQTSPAQ